jgi:hypothetical protein
MRARPRGDQRLSEGVRTADLDDMVDGRSSAGAVTTLRIDGVPSEALQYPAYRRNGRVR